VINAVVTMVKAGIKDWIGILLCIATFVLASFTKVSPIFSVVGAALIGLGVQLGLKKGGKSGKKQASEPGEEGEGKA
nr:hypothetical protein [bacterium]